MAAMITRRIRTIVEVGLSWPGDSLSNICQDCCSGLKNTSQDIVSGNGFLMFSELQM